MMSQNEQDAVIGRTIREKAELTKELATIDANLRQLAAAFGGFSVEISERTSRGSTTTEPTSEEPLLIPPVLAECGEFHRVARLVDERRETYRRLRETLGLLEQMGVK